MDAAIPESLNQLVSAAWNQYERYKDHPNIVKPSVPILYFGNYHAYSNSPCRIVTVGLNPSKAEFPVENPYMRFPSARSVYPAVMDPGDEQSRKQYLGSLNDYFCGSGQPYMRWFNSLVPLLSGIPAAFTNGGQNTALHTDICSCLATDPTWSNLEDQIFANMLARDGLDLWHRLITFLKPHAILVSVRKALVTQIRFESLREWEAFDTTGEGDQSPVYRKPVCIPPDHVCYLFYGRAAQMPFGLLPNARKMSIGQNIGKFLTTAAKRCEELR